MLKGIDPALGYELCVSKADEQRSNRIESTDMQNTKHHQGQEPNLKTDTHKQHFPHTAFMAFN